MAERKIKCEWCGCDQFYYHTDEENGIERIKCSKCDAVRAEVFIQLPADEPIFYRGSHPGNDADRQFGYLPDDD